MGRMTLPARDWRWARPRLWWWLDQGSAGGIVAGVVLAVFEIVQVGGGPSARIAAGIVTAGAALDPGYPLGSAVVAGVALHVLLSAAFGALFGLVMSSAEMSLSTAVVVGAGGLYGVALWVVNFVAVASLAGWDWVRAGADPLYQIPAHAVFYGTVLGYYTDRALEWERARALDNARRMRAPAPHGGSATLTRSGLPGVSRG